MKTNTVAAAGDLQVKRTRGIWQISKDGLLCAERPDRATALSRARELALELNVGVEVLYSNGRVWWHETPEQISSKLASNSKSKRFASVRVTNKRTSTYSHEHYTHEHHS